MGRTVSRLFGDDAIAIIGLGATLALLLPGCVAADDGDSGSDAASGAGGTPSGSDGGTPSGSEGGTPAPTTTASFEGEFYAGFYGSDFGHVDVTIAANGKLTGTATRPDGTTITGEGVLTDAGDATFSLTGATPVGPYSVSYQGRFRMERGHTLGTGQWSSTSGYSGDWVASRKGDDFLGLLQMSREDLTALCTRLAQLCPASHIGTLEECLAGANCQIGLYAAKTTDCIGFYDEWVGMWAAVESADECDSTQPKDEWVQTCPDPGICYQ